MIAVDTSSLIAYLSGAQGPDVDSVERAFHDELAVLPPPVLAEVLSDPVLLPELRHTLKELPLLELTEGYWERAGLLRARVLGSGRKARLADALIAQSCLDVDVPLITRDRDFRHFARAARLKVLP